MALSRQPLQRPPTRVVERRHLLSGPSEGGMAVLLLNGSVLIDVSYGSSEEMAVTIDIAQVGEPRRDRLLRRPPATSDA